MKVRTALIASLCLLPAFGQMTPDQRLVDFRSLASLYAKQYAPYEWKRDVIGFDMYLLAPWIERVQNARDDLDFYGIMKQYVASLNDAHSTYYLPSYFYADLGFSSDIYDGRIVFDLIDRSMLPSRVYPFVEGDEIVSIDGVPAPDLVTSFMKYDSYGNERATRRYFADFLGFRPQYVLPRANELGDSAKVVVRRQSGVLETYEIPWLKQGRPITLDGPVPSPVERPMAVTPVQTTAAPGKRVRGAAAGAGVALPPRQVVDRTGPLVRRVFNQKRTFKAPHRDVRGVASRTPFYTLPSSFTVRLGRSSSDAIYSGVYTAGTYKIGFIRIPDFDPAAGTPSGLRQFQTEIAYFKQNTDGLVIDVGRDPGGDGCYAQDMLATLATKRINITGEEMRPTLFWVNYLDQWLSDAFFYGYEEWEINLLTAIQRDIETAFKENRGRTGALGLCTGSLTEEPMTDRNGSLYGYTKPMLLLIDEFSTSAAEIFAAGFQDNGFGPLFGMRTSGGGGAILINSPIAGFYSEGTTSTTLSLLVRSKSVSMPGFPVTNYIENVGVQPDIPYDVQTMDNLLQKGKPFVDAFTAALVDLIQKGAKP